jgi:3-oxoacyl-(acyl-carrier-protein) synthase
MPPDVLSWPVGEIPGEVTGPEGAYVTFAIDAGSEALAQAGLDGSAIDLLVVGTTAGPRFSPDWTFIGLQPPPGVIDGPMSLSVGSERIRQALGVDDRALTVSCGCTTGVVSIATAWRAIRTGRARTVLAVTVDELWFGTVMGLGATGALSDIGCDPYQRSDGTSFGECAAAMVLTSTPGPQDALCYVVGAGQTSDAFHPNRPDPTGEPAFRAIEQAVQLVPDRTIAMVSGHGTGTRANDRAEAKITDLMEERLPGAAHRPPTFATKGLYGHTWGACGMVETIELISALRGEVDISRVAHLDGPPTPAPVGDTWLGVKNGYAFGGVNASVAVASHPTATETTAMPSRAVAVAAAGRVDRHTGVVTLGCDDAHPARIAFDDLGSYAAKHQRSRRSRWATFDLLSQLVTGLASSLLESSGTAEVLSPAEIGLFIGTQRGPAKSWRIVTESHHSGAAIDGNVVPNLTRHASVANATEHLGLQGPSVAVYLEAKDGRTTVDAAVALIESGGAKAVLAIEADEAYDESGGPLSDGAGCRRLDGEELPGPGARQGPGLAAHYVLTRPKP